MLTCMPDQVLRLIRRKERFDGPIIVADNLRIYGRKGRFHLPSRMQVEGALHIVDCPDLEELPTGLVVQANLLLQGCPSLKVIPPDLKVMETIFIDRHMLPPDEVSIDGIYGNGIDDLQIYPNVVMVPQQIPDAICRALIGRRLGDLVDHPHLRWRRTCDREVIAFQHFQYHTAFALEPRPDCDRKSPIDLDDIR